MFWAEADVDAVTEGPYLIDYVRYAYRRQVSTPAQAGRILMELLTVEAVIGRDVVDELGAFLTDDFEPLPEGLDIPLLNVVDGMNCFAMERTLLNRDPQLSEEDGRRGETTAEGGATES